jgi:hypothetical protein
VSVLGLLVSIPVGLWAINTLRNPEIRAFLGAGSQPADFSTALVGLALGNGWAGFTGKQRGVTLGVGGVALLLLAILVLLLQGERAPRPPAPGGGSSSPETKGPMSADDIAAAFVASEPSASNRLKGHVLQVSGTVSAPGVRRLLDQSGKSYELASVIFKTHTPLRVRCDFKDPAITYDQAAAMVGRTLVLSGECRGVEKAGDVWIKDCEILSTSSTGPAGKPAGPSKSAYNSGYQEGLNLGNEYARRLQGMAPTARNEFRNVYANELQTHERNRDDVVRAYGAGNDNAQNKMGFCDGLRAALQKAGIP